VKKQITILGSTGSIGTQALQVIKEQAEYFEVFALTAYNNADLLIEQSLRFKPAIVVVGNEEKYEYVREALRNEPVTVFAGAGSVADVAAMDTADIVLTAMVGYAGLQPTIRALKAGKTIALANKETLVVAGDLICRIANENNCSITPVDSEHSAIFQCLTGELNPVEKVILTASGGPFRGKDRVFLEKVTLLHALKHPNWDMGAKITIDSASLMNKGFEVIEAKWLFGLLPEQIEVVVHPQSVIHSMVQFEDGSIKAQLGLPDMKLPIQYAFTYPDRIRNNYPRLDFSQYTSLTFEKPDTTVFRNLLFAYEAMKKEGNMACILNAANEVAVDAFMREKIGFIQMSDIIEKTMQTVSYIAEPSYEDYVLTDEESRKIAMAFCK
jgi:1-deoxy-D-xylulose-5-phosphate reductoisomerase